MKLDLLLLFQVSSGQWIAFNHKTNFWYFYDGRFSGTERNISGSSPCGSVVISIGGAAMTIGAYEALVIYDDCVSDYIPTDNGSTAVTNATDCWIN